MTGKQGKNGKSQTSSSGKNGLKPGKQCYCNALPFMVCYSFQCVRCNPTKEETWMPKKADPRLYFQEIIPYVDDKWIYLTSMPRRVKSTWHQTLYRAMAKESDLFSQHQEEGSTDSYFCLVEKDLSKIGPNWEVVKNLGRKPVAQDKSGNGANGPGGSEAEGEGPKTRGAKRKAETQANSGAKRSKGTDSTYTKFSGYAYPVDHPFNRDGYRYYLAEPDSHAPNRQEFDEKEETAGKPIPAYMYRTVRPSIVELSSHDRAPQLKLGDDRLSVTGEKGYSVVRGSHGVSRGCWYFEVTITDQPEGSHFRIGWSQPLGKHYSSRGYTVGDVIGCYIELPLERFPQDLSLHIPNCYKDLPLIKFKHHYYYEEKDDVQKALKELRTLSGSKIIFYRNGESQGVAFRDFYAGVYHPSISIYKSASVRANFGPKFKFPPKDVSFKPSPQASVAIPLPLYPIPGLAVSKEAMATSPTSPKINLRLEDYLKALSRPPFSLGFNPAAQTTAISPTAAGLSSLQAAGILAHLPHAFLPFPFLNPALNVFNPNLNAELAKNVQGAATCLSPVRRAVEEQDCQNQDSWGLGHMQKSNIASKKISKNYLAPKYTSPKYQKNKFMKTRKNSPGLRHLEELSKIRRQRFHYFKDNVKQVSECRICGTCSFAGTTKFLGTFMRQHLYTHVNRALFTCKKCADFQCSSKGTHP